MKNEKMREMTEVELNANLEAEERLFNLRFQHVTGQLETHQDEGYQKEIARVKPNSGRKN